MTTDTTLDLFDQFLESEQGQSFAEFEQWLLLHPDRTDQLRVCWRNWRRGQEVLRMDRVLRPTRAPHRAGDTVGEFTLIALLGRGGQAEVWEAEQAGLGRRVALKLLRSDRDSERDMALFQREARAGARLRHEGVVIVHDFGEQDGVPWIAQELISGGRCLRDRIDEVRQEAKVPELWYTEVAELVRNVAQALHAAHAVGIIHRDVKPQNILIDRAGTPKLGDFGLARLEDTSALSVSGQVVGTYFYMSPEQVLAKRDGIDHRSDIFSLGVVLYELLTLSRPFHGDTAQQVCSQIVEHEALEPRLLRSQVPRDLSVICCKALEKDRNRRYADATALADDIGRFLSNRPILARPPTRLELATKWMGRHPTWSASAGIGLVALVAISFLLVVYIRKADETDRANVTLEQRTEELASALALASAQTAEARRNSLALEVEKDRVVAEKAQVEVERAKAQAEKKRLETVVEFQTGMFDTLSPNSFGARLRKEIQSGFRLSMRRQRYKRKEIKQAFADLEALLDQVNFTTPAVRALTEEILDPASEKVARDFPADPMTRAQLQTSLASAYLQLGSAVEAVRLTQAAFEIRREELGESDPITLANLESLGLMYSSVGMFDEAMECQEQALRGRREAFGEDYLYIGSNLNNKGILLQTMGKPGEALLLHDEALELLYRFMGSAVGDRHPHVAAVLIGKGAALSDLGREPESIACTEKALKIYRHANGEDDLGALKCMNNLALSFQALGDYAKALEYLETAVQASARRFGENHDQTLLFTNNLAVLLQVMGRYDEALVYQEGTLESLRLAVGANHPDTIRAMNNMAVLLAMMERSDEALVYAQSTLEQRKRSQRKGHPDTTNSMDLVAGILLRLDRADEARALYEEELGLLREGVGEDHEDTVFCLGNLGYLEMTSGNHERALSLLMQVLEWRREHSSNSHPATLVSTQNLGDLLTRMGRAEEARELLEPAVEDARRVLPETHRARKGLLGVQARCYDALHADRPDGGFDAMAARCRTEADALGK